MIPEDLYLSGIDRTLGGSVRSLPPERLVSRYHAASGFFPVSFSVTSGDPYINLIRSRVYPNRRHRRPTPPQLQPALAAASARAHLCPSRRAHSAPVPPRLPAPPQLLLPTPPQPRPHTSTHGTASCAVPAPPPAAPPRTTVPTEPRHRASPTSVHPLPEPLCPARTLVA